MMAALEASKSAILPRYIVDAINSLNRLVLHVLLVTEENVLDFLFRDLPKGASVSRSSRLVL